MKVMTKRHTCSAAHAAPMSWGGGLRVTASAAIACTAAWAIGQAVGPAQIPDVPLSCAIACRPL